MHRDETDKNEATLINGSEITSRRCESIPTLLKSKQEGLLSGLIRSSRYAM